MKILYCYGDSNTWGYDSRSVFGERYPKNRRWTGILAEYSDYQIVNDGRNGRKIPNDKYQLNLLAHNLLNSMELEKTCKFWIMLGTNDLLDHPERGACYVASKMDWFLYEWMQLLKKKSINIHIRLISPPALRRGAWVETDELVKQSILVGEKLKAIAEKHKVAFTDAGKWEIPTLFDGVHFSENGHCMFAKEMLHVLEIM